MTHRRHPRRRGGRAAARRQRDRRASAAASGPSRPAPSSSSLTFGWRALLKIKHVPEQLFDVTMFPILFTLMFTYVFGGAISGIDRRTTSSTPCPGSSPRRSSSSRCTPA